MTVTSMTGFAVEAGQSDTLDWQWEARSVNHRGLDLRLRLPDGLEALEPQVRAAAQKQFTRGSIQVSLRVTQAEGAASQINAPALDRALSALVTVSAAAAAKDIALAPPSAADVLGLRGVQESGRSADALQAAAPAIATGIAPLMTALAAARAAEGRALGDVLARQIDTVEALTAQATATAEARAVRQKTVLADRVAALLSTQDHVEEGRLAQELALLAVKADVTEELDRLSAHIAAARDLLTKTGAVGRRFDFLVQEFNREANTLCSKAQDTALTAIGLELKAVIDQMREQCQNVE